MVFQAPQGRLLFQWPAWPNFPSCITTLEEFLGAYEKTPTQTMHQIHSGITPRHAETWKSWTPELSRCISGKKIGVIFQQSLCDRLPQGVLNEIPLFLNASNPLNINLSYLEKSSPTKRNFVAFPWRKYVPSRQKIYHLPLPTHGKLSRKTKKTSRITEVGPLGSWENVRNGVFSPLLGVKWPHLPNYLRPWPHVTPPRRAFGSRLH